MCGYFIPEDLLIAFLLYSLTIIRFAHDIIMCHTGVVEYSFHVKIKYPYFCDPSASPVLCPPLPING